MKDYIIYKNSDNSVSIIIPSMECGLSIDEIALKDTPRGVPFKFISKEDLPTDRTYRDAWEADFSNPDGYGLGPDKYYEYKILKK